MMYPSTYLYAGGTDQMPINIIYVCVYLCRLGTDVKSPICEPFQIFTFKYFWHLHYLTNIIPVMHDNS